MTITNDEPTSENNKTGQEKDSPERIAPIEEPLGNPPASEVPQDGKDKEEVPKEKEDIQPR